MFREGFNISLRKWLLALLYKLSSYRPIRNKVYLQANGFFIIIVLDHI